MTQEKYEHNPTRVLARELFYEALRMELAAPRPPRNLGGRPRTWTREAVLRAIQDYVERTGTVPADPQFRHASQHALPARMSVLWFWPTLGDAVREAGYTPVPRKRKPPHTSQKRMAAAAREKLDREHIQED